MPKIPTAKTKRQTVSLDDCLWPIFVEACGGVCCDCKQPPTEVGPLHHGHIWRAEDGGPTTLENLQPICKPCNGKYNQHFDMPDFRPTNWRSRFIELVVRTFRKGVVALSKNTEDVNTQPDQNSLENIRVIVRNDGIFAADCELPHTLIPGHDTPPLDEILAMVEALISAGIRQSVAIPVPDDKCQKALKQLIHRAGRKDFLAARDEFLLRRDWYDQDEKTGRVTRFGGDPWPRFVNGFSVYLKLAEARPPEPTIEQIKALEIAFAKSHTETWQPIDTAAEAARELYRKSKKYELIRSLETLGQRVIDRELRFTQEATAEMARLRKLIEAASDNAPELADYRAQLVICTKKGLIMPPEQQAPEPEQEE
jgi:hypothetical protein